jgi:tetratricopeptide (TPR) repeat protein
MSSAEALQRAIQVARAGRKDEARELFLDIVESDPHNETAWIWLSGLVDSLEDRIIACENALTINPANEKVRAYLTQLQRQQVSSLQPTARQEAASLLKEANEFRKRNEKDAALQLARHAIEKHPQLEQAWVFIGRISADVDERIAALQTAARLNPSNAATRAYLKEAQHLKENPLSAATHLEQQGDLEGALKAYEGLAAKAKNSQQFDYIYRQIVRLEALQRENIRYVAPESSILRLTFSWPLLYLSLAFIQVGLNPFAHPSFSLWSGLPIVALGSFLLSLAEVRSRHAVWQKIFDEHGDGSKFARLVTAAFGWFLILIPHLLLVIDSLNRLRNFTIPPMPN